MTSAQNVKDTKHIEPVAVHSAKKQESVINDLSTENIGKIKKIEADSIDFSLDDDVATSIWAQESPETEEAKFDKNPSFTSVDRSKAIISHAVSTDFNSKGSTNSTAINRQDKGAEKRHHGHRGRGNGGRRVRGVARNNSDENSYNGSNTERNDTHSAKSPNPRRGGRGRGRGRSGHG